MSKLIPVDSSVVESVWPDVEPLVARCFKKIKEYRWAPADILFYLREREMQLWVVADATGMKGIVITQIIVSPLARECVIFMICGSLPDDWRTVQASVEQWARDMQCTHVSAMSRPGSARINGMTKGLIHTYKEL